jgi:hypothetical protein
VMEHKGSDPNRIHGSVHYPGFSGGNAVTATTLIQQANSTFHCMPVNGLLSPSNFM